MREIYQIEGAGNNSGLKIYEADENAFIIQIPKVLTSRSWRYLILGITLLLLSIFIPILVQQYIFHFLLKVGFFIFSLAMLFLGGGLAIIATYEIKSAMEIKMKDNTMTIYQPAFFEYRSLTRTYAIDEINKLYVIKVRKMGKEKYALMISNADPLDERLIKGFYVPEQALWIASEVNRRLTNH